MIPTARNVLTRPPTGTPRRAICPGEGLPTLYTSLKGSGRGCPCTARIERPLLHRGGSASKKGTWPLPSHPSEAARCASTGIVPATPPPFSASCLAIFGEADKIQVVVVIGENRFRLVAEAHEKVDVPGGAQHGAGKEFMGIDGNSFDFAN
jgi:hypothetical protein